MLWVIQRTTNGISLHIIEDGEQPTVGVIAQGELSHPGFIDPAIGMFHTVLQTNLDALGFSFEPGPDGGWG